MFLYAELLNRPGFPIPVDKQSRRCHPGWLHPARGGWTRGMTQNHGPIEEPENGTVDDWHGQMVADDAELLDETDGDTERAGELFEERSADNDLARDINRPEPKWPSQAVWGRRQG